MLSTLKTIIKGRMQTKKKLFKTLPLLMGKTKSKNSFGSLMKEELIALCGPTT
jgi:hypothetical protein